jgi:RNA polymerase sigma factor (sigma-70 family)
MVCSCVNTPGDFGTVEGMRPSLEAFAALYEEHFDDVFGYLCRRVGRDDGEDLAAQTFGLALRDLESYDAARGSMRAWVFGIAANVLRGHRRGEERRLRALARTGVDPLLSELDGLDERLDAERTMRALAGVLAALPAGDREVLLLFAWAGLTSDEIGFALSIPPGTARSRLNRTRRRLQSALAETEQPRSRTAQEALDG